MNPIAVMSVPNDMEPMCDSFMPQPINVGRGAHRLYYVYALKRETHKRTIENSLEILRERLFLEYLEFRTLEEACAWVEADCAKRLMN